MSWNAIYRCFVALGAALRVAVALGIAVMLCSGSASADSGERSNEPSGLALVRQLHLRNGPLLDLKLSGDHRGRLGARASLAWRDTVRARLGLAMALSADDSAVAALAAAHGPFGMVSGLAAQADLDGALVVSLGADAALTCRARWTRTAQLRPNRADAG
ncbi:MAG: hypothetical protein AAGC55_22245, partial [Myxococcota bacterium]